jgi:ABC-2 type transport system ATP-binding protein
MKDIVVDLSRRGKTILFSTHIMEQAEKLCDSVCIIARGEKVIDGPLTEVKREHSGRHVVVALESGEALSTPLFKERSLVARADDYGQYAELELEKDVDPQTLLSRLVQSGTRVQRFEIAEPTLNKIFIDLVGPDAATAPANEDQGNV